MATTDWNSEWSAANYEWPVTSVPDADTVDRIGRHAVARGGRAVKEAHADRGIVMDFPNAAVPGTHIRKQVPRAECRRRAQVTLPNATHDPLKVCVVCDAAHLWPVFAADAA